MKTSPPSVLSLCGRKDGNIPASTFKHNSGSQNHKKFASFPRGGSTPAGPAMIWKNLAFHYGPSKLFKGKGICIIPHQKLTPQPAFHSVLAILASNIHLSQSNTIFSLNLSIPLGDLFPFPTILKNPLRAKP